MKLNAAPVFCEKGFIQRSEWKWWSGLLAGILICLISLVIGVWMVLSSTVGRVSDLHIIIMILICQFFIVVSLVFLASLADTDKWSKVYLIRVKLREPWVIAFIAIALGVWCFGIIWDSLFPEALKNDSQGSVRDLQSADTRLAEIVSAVIGAPISEELLYRGFMLPPLAKTRLGFWGATIVTTLLWTATHYYSWQGSLYIMGVGFALSYLLWRTGSILPSIALHGLLNLNDVIQALY